MSESTKDMLTKHMESIRQDVEEYARQIESGEYGQRWEVVNSDGDTLGEVVASDEDQALDKAEFQWGETAEVAGLVLADEPATTDEYGNDTPISEWPLSVEVKVGRPLTVLLCTGGPHIEIVHDLSDGPAKLAGYWGGEKVYMHGKEFQTVLDYLTDGLYDEVPEEWK